jgi:hypothetical protein
MAHGGDDVTSPTARQRWRDAIRDSDDPAIDAYTIAVAFALDRHMSADGHTFTGTRRLERLAHVGSQATVKKRLGWLVETGWLTREWAGRGHKAYYQVSYPVAHLGVGQDVAHSPEVSHLVTEVSHLVTQSGLPGSSDPLYPDDPEGRRGGGGELKLPAASAPPPDGAGGAAKGQTIAPRGEHQRWMVNVLSELGWDPDDIDLYDQRLIDASAPLLDRRPSQIRDAIGRHPKGVRESVRDPAAFVASKLSKLHDLADDNPRWTPRPPKPAKPSTPSSNGNGRDWRTVYDTYYEPICDRLHALDEAEFWEGDEEIGGHLAGSLTTAFDDELDRFAGFWEQPKENGTPVPFKAKQVEAIRGLCENVERWLEERGGWSDRFIDAFRVRASLPKCRLCGKRLAGNVAVVDGAHDFCVEEQARTALAGQPVEDLR